MVTDKQRGMRRFAKGHGPKLRILINILEQRLIQEAAEHDNASIETTQIEEICHSLSEDISTLSNLVYQILDAYQKCQSQIRGIQIQKGVCISRWQNKVSATRCFAVRGNRHNNSHTCLGPTDAGGPL